MISTTTPDGPGLIAELDLSAHELHRLTQGLQRTPLPWSELADLGHRSPLGKQFANGWIDYRTPSNFLSVRNFIGTRLLMDTAASYGFPASGASIQELLSSRAPVKHIRRSLVEQLLATDPVVPWPSLRAPYPSVLVMVPRDACTASVFNASDDCVAAIAIYSRDGEGGLELMWTAWGWNGAEWGDNWSTKPLMPYPISRLAWGIVALLNTAIEVQGDPETPSVGGAIRSRRERPEPAWVEPRRIHTRHDEGRCGQTDPRRPHWRQAHPHRFWTGSRKGQRRLVTHWLPAIWVDPALEDDD